MRSWCRYVAILATVTANAATALGQAMVVALAPASAQAGDYFGWSVDLVLSVSSVPAGAPIVLIGARGSAAPHVALGEGVLCIDPGPGGLRRVSHGVASPTGALEFSSSANPQMSSVAGATMLFQPSYGDPTSACGVGSNLTNGLAVTFLP